MRNITVANAYKEIMETIQMTAKVPGDVLVPDFGARRSASGIGQMLI
jgi:hypothetical protein